MTGQRFAGRELVTQFALGDSGAPSIVPLIALPVFAGVVVAAVLSVVAAALIVALWRLVDWQAAPGLLAAWRASTAGAARSWGT